VLRLIAASQGPAGFRIAQPAVSHRAAPGGAWSWPAAPRHSPAGSTVDVRLARRSLQTGYAAPNWRPVSADSITLSDIEPK